MWKELSERRAVKVFVRELLHDVAQVADLA